MDDQPGPSSSSSSSAASGSVEAQKRSDRLKKLRELHAKRNEASQLNHKEVVEEYKRNKLPANYEKKREWVDHKVNEAERREAADAEGVDYDRIKMLDVQADDAERWERKRKAKRNEDPGFSGFEQATARQYNRCVKGLKPDFEEYEKMKEEMGDEAFYAGRDTLINGMHKDSNQSIDRMVEDLNNQISKRDKYSRRRKFDDDADVDYINERNMKFNKKLERFYGEYTTEIKQNLERGTAI
jgi:pre-mRNA-splicing factor SYF2